ncbi:hypothetical protein H6503_05095 [Candidatus Woesearchaeota archaeon]|nr:hypothetical protein [Candidatus Woesearchaeota archaeon]
MSTSGSSIHEKLKSYSSAASTDYDSAHQLVNSIEQRLISLNSSREEVILKLAKNNLPELDANDIENCYASARIEISEILVDKIERRESLSEKIKAHNAEIVELNSRVELESANLTALSERLDELTALAADKLKSNAIYQDKALEASATRTELESDRILLDVIAKDFSGKADAIFSNKYFQYLHGRNYGEGKTSALDDLMAARCGYDKTSRQFVHYNDLKKAHLYLTTLPVEMKKDLEKREAELVKLEAEVDKIEADTSRELGIDDVHAEIASSSKKKEELLNGLQRKEHCLHDYQDELQELSGKRGRYYRQALSLLAETLGRESIERLKREARKTPGSEDDNLVATLENLDQQIIDVQGSLDKASEKAKKLSTVSRQLSDLVNMYDRADYEISRSYFPDAFSSQLGRTVEAYILCATADDNEHVEQVTKDQIWRLIKSKQNFKPVETYTSYNPTFPSSSRRSSSPTFPSYTSTRRRSSSPSWGGGGGGIRIGGGGFSGGGGVRIGGKGF